MDESNSREMTAQEIDRVEEEGKCPNCGGDVSLVGQGQVLTYQCLQCGALFIWVPQS